MINVDTSNLMSFINENEMEKMLPQVELAHTMLHKKSGPGSDFLGWLELPSKYDKNEFIRIRQAATRIRKDSDVLLVIGIGGSYLGARAAIELLSHSFANMANKKIRNCVKAIMAASPFRLSERRLKMSLSHVLWHQWDTRSL